GRPLGRLPRRPVLIAAAAVQAVAALALTQVSGIGPVLALAAGFGVGAAVLQPGLGAIVPRLAGPAGPAGPLDRVSQVGVTRANSYLQAATWGGFTAGPPPGRGAPPPRGGRAGPGRGGRPPPPRGGRRPGRAAAAGGPRAPA